MWTWTLSAGQLLKSNQFKKPHCTCTHPNEITTMEKFKFRDLWFCWTVCYLRDIKLCRQNETNLVFTEHVELKYMCLRPIDKQTKKLSISFRSAEISSAIKNIWSNQNQIYDDWSSHYSHLRLPRIRPLKIRALQKLTKFSRTK